jgi:hypothetical protein
MYRGMRSETDPSFLTAVQRLSALEREAAASKSNDRRMLLHERISLARELLRVAAVQTTSAEAANNLTSAARNG